MYEYATRGEVTPRQWTSLLPATYATFETHPRSRIIRPSDILFLRHESGGRKTDFLFLGKVINEYKNRLTPLHATRRAPDSRHR